MDDSEFDQMIDVNKLQPGMFIHLDQGWMSHPFAWNSFKIGSWSQVSTLRSLGLKQVRWSPPRSEVTAPPQAHARRRSAGAAAPPAGMVPEAPARRRNVAEPRVLRHKMALVAYAQLLDCLPVQAPLARERAEALVADLLDDLLGMDERKLCLIVGSSADRESTHALNVCIVSLMLGLNLGLDQDELMTLGQGALLHDIGRLGAASGAEQPGGRSRYQEHVFQGLALAQRMHLPPAAQQIIAQHHEYADGSGFPAGVTLDAMSVGSRIVALVNRFDGLCNPLKVSRALSPHDAISLMFAQDRHRFGLNMLNALVRMVGVYPPGSPVQLTDDRYALVMSANASKALKPSVLAYPSGEGTQQAEFIDLASCPALGIRRGIKPELEGPLLRAGRQRTSYFFESGLQSDAALMA